MLKKISVAFAALVVAACATPALAQSKCEKIDTFVIARFVPAYHAVPLLYAIEKGFDKEACLEIKQIEVPNLSQMLLALQQGSENGGADAVTTTDAGWLDVGKQVPDNERTVVTMTISQLHGFSLVGQKDGNLSGADVAVSNCPEPGRVTGSTTATVVQYLRDKHPTLKIVCAEKGEDKVVHTPQSTTGQVRLVPRGFSTARFKCVEIGECRFAVLFTPQEYLASKTSGLGVLATPQDVGPYLDPAIVMKRKTADALQKSGVLERFRDMHNRASKALHDDPAQAKAYIMRQAGDAKGGSLRVLAQVPDQVDKFYDNFFKPSLSLDGCISKTLLASTGKAQGNVDYALNLIHGSACVTK